MYDINEMKLGELKQIAALFGSVSQAASAPSLNSMIGQKVIVRTYSAGVWFGEIAEKAGSEVIIKNARRLWQWHAAEGISLSSVAIHGVKHKNSKIVEAVESVWLEAVELIPCAAKAVNSIESAPNVQAQ